MGKRVPPVRPDVSDEEIQRLYRALGGRRPLARYLGCTNWQARRRIIEAGATRETIRETLAGLDWERLYHQHGSERKLAAALGVVHYTVRRYLRGYRRPPQRRAPRRGDP